VKKDFGFGGLTPTGTPAPKEEGEAGKKGFGLGGATGGFGFGKKDDGAGGVTATKEEEGKKDEGPAGKGFGFGLGQGIYPLRPSICLSE